jgi:hypothetical protein
MENYEKYLASEDYKDYFNSPVSNLDISEELIKQLKLFQQYHSVKKIYYPCCATDVSVSKAFNNCKIIYADLNKFAIDLLRIYP